MYLESFSIFSQFLFRDFHSDLYPDTPGCVTELTAMCWFQGKNIPVSKISLDPAKRPNAENPITVRELGLISFFFKYQVFAVCN